MRQTQHGQSVRKGGGLNPPALSDGPSCICGKKCTHAYNQELSTPIVLAITYSTFAKPTGKLSLFFYALWFNRACIGYFGNSKTSYRQTGRLNILRPVGHLRRVCVSAHVAILRWPFRATQQNLNYTRDIKNAAEIYFKKCMQILKSRQGCGQ